MKKNILTYVLFPALLGASLTLKAQNTLPVQIIAEPWWNPDSTWVMAFPGFATCPTTSIGLSTPVRLSGIPNTMFTLNQGFSGRIYFFTGQGDSSLIMPYVAGVPADTTFPVRYDFVEITYFGNSNDCANLSMVDQIGINLSIATIANGQKTGSRGSNVNLPQLRKNLDTVATDSLNEFWVNGQFIRVMSPLHAPNAYFNLGSYLRLTLPTDSVVQLFGMYDGSKAAYIDTVPDGDTTIYHTFSAQPFYYNAVCNATNDTLVLSPHSSVAGSAVFLQGTIRVAVSDLQNMLYACDGPFQVSVDSGAYAPAVSPDRIGFNDPWSTVMRNYLVGYNLGYYNTSINGINGDFSWAWNGNFAFNYMHNDTGYYNQYASILQNYTNAYGFPFTDFIDDPLLSIYGCDTFRISLWSDTTHNFSDYTSLAPDTSGALRPTGSDTNYAQNIVFDFGSGVGCPQYGGKLNFMGYNFASGYNYTQLDTTSSNQTICGNITLTGFPIQFGALNRYPFSAEGSSFHLYLRADSTGLFTEAFTDNNNLVATIGSTGIAVTVSNLLYAISPAYLAGNTCGCLPATTTQKKTKNKTPKSRK